MRYLLTKPFLGQHATIEIAADEYSRIQLVRRHLVEAMVIEEKFDLVAENYEEFESDLLRITLRSALFEELTWAKRINELQRIDRRLVNLLTTCRLYLDQVSHNLSSMLGREAEQLQAFRQLCGAEYDSNLGYRFMEALRNYVQHRELPVTSIGFNSNRLEEGPRSVLRHITTPRISIAALREDKKFKRSILIELDGLGDELDLKLLAREYVSGIGRIHKNLREQLASDTKRWDQSVKEVMGHFCGVAGEDDFGLVAIVENESGSRSGIVHIGTDISERRQALEAKNRYISNYGQHVISGESYTPGA